MKQIYAILFFIFLSFNVYAYVVKEVTKSDTSEVIMLNKNGYNNRFTNPKETVADAKRALELAIKIDYQSGKAEAYRIMGIGEYYLNKPDSALNHYFLALEFYKDDERSKANVNNNIGNLYQMVDYDKALYYFNQAKEIAEKYHDKELTAKLYLNMGNIYNRKTMYNNALVSYKKSYDLFTELKDPVNLVQCLEDLGVIHYYLRNYSESKKLLLDANKRAKAMDMNAAVAAINMTLTDIYIAESNFTEAEKYIEEGRTYSILINNEKDIYEFKHSAYELERKRKNYEKALNYLIEIYQLDSTNYKASVSTKLNLLQQEQEHLVQNTETQINAKYSRIKFWAVAVVAGLLLIVVGLLISNVKRKAVTNLQLQELNSEVSRQKDNLDRINHHLEEIIDERTKDLQVKNKKLSEYSSYLSHQIRGPIATLKGLMNLEKEGLVDKQECISMMDKCVSEIDEKIIEMSDMLHDPGKAGF
jgi:tetratricopeptide (TPR) repeat protein